MAIKPEDPNKPKWKPALQNEVKTSVELSTLFIVILVAISNRLKFQSLSSVEVYFLCLVPVQKSWVTSDLPSHCDVEQGNESATKSRQTK